jgi:dTDP-4-amino-4,6-dideoxy-D-galactose acyltransferase
MNAEELRSLRSLLTETLPWSPLDFIPGISLLGDRALFATQLTADLPPENDLRCTTRLPDGSQVGVFAEKLAWESNFFGRGIGKLHGIFPLEPPYYRPFADYSAVLDEAIGIARHKNVTYCFGAVDPRDLALIRALGHAGFSLVEPRLYYHRDLRTYAWPERYPVRSALPEDVGSLGRTAAEMINMFDRFHADPFYTAEDSARLMHKWIEAALLEGYADVTLVPDVERPTALCTVRYHKDKWPLWTTQIAQMTLAAVSPEFKGWFRKLASETNYHLRDMGAEHIFFSSQMTNRPIIATWEKLGFHYGKGELILSRVL